MRLRIPAALAAAAAALGLAAVPAQAAPRLQASAPTQCSYSSHFDAAYVYWIDANCTADPGQTWHLWLECQGIYKPQIVFWRGGNNVTGSGTSSATCGPLTTFGPSYHRVIPV